MASNDPYDRLWRSSAELLEEACRRKTIPHLLLASYVVEVDGLTVVVGLRGLGGGRGRPHPADRSVAPIR